jgi:hypothetical protein
MRIKNLVIMRANPDSPFGRENKDLAFAVDAHKCLLFLCKDVGGSASDKLQKSNIVEVEIANDLPFEDLYGRFLA